MGLFLSEPRVEYTPRIKMADEHEEQFEQAQSGASLTFPKQCSALRKGGHVMIKGRPCKIVEMSTSKTGKHGHAKVHLVALDIFTDKKLEDICPSTHNMDVPNVQRKDYQLLDIVDDFLSLMDDTGEQREDVPVPEGKVGDEIREKHENNDEGNIISVTLLSAVGEELAISVKSSTA